VKIFGCTGTLLLILCCFSLPLSALSIRGDVLWDDQPMAFQFIVDESRYRLTVETHQNKVLRVLADMENGDLLIIDDMMEQFASVNSKQLIAVTALFALGEIIGVEENWLQENSVNFYPTDEKKTYDPFGECMKLRVNDSVSGMYWSNQTDNVLIPFFSPFLQKLLHDGIRFPFWESMMRMKGFVIANEKEGKTIYRLVEIGDIPLDWDNALQHDEYVEREWVDFLSPFRVVD